MSEPSHPSYTFRVKLELNRTEAVGPNTNLVNPHILHPSMYQHSADQGQSEKANFKNTRSVMLNSIFGGGGTRELGHGDEFTVSGQKAVYLRDMYVSGSWNGNNPPGGDLLDIV